MTNVILAWSHQHPNLLPERGSQSAGGKKEAENSRKEAEEQRKKKEMMVAVMMVVVMTVVTSFESLDPAIPEASSLSFQFHKNQHTSLFDLG